MKNLRVLIVTHHALNESGGGSFGSRAYINAFAECYDSVTLIYPDYGGDMETFVNKKVCLIPCSDKRTLLRKIFDFYTGNIHRFKKLIFKQLKSHTYDMLIFDRSIVSANIINRIKEIYTNIIIVTIHHNVECNYYKDNPLPLIIRYPFMYYLRKAEWESVNLSNLNLTVTQEDALYFQRINKNRNNSIEYMGTFEFPERHKEIINNTISKEICLVISGSLSFKQSEEAIIWFLENIYSKVVKKAHMKLVITGRNPSNKLHKTAIKYKDVQVVANPDNISEVVSRGVVYVCPVFGGSGVKLRVMDGLRLGMPVLCDYRSIAGYEDIIRDGFMFSYSDSDSFMNALNEAIKLKNRNDVLDSYYRRFSFESGTKRLKEILVRNSLL